MGLQIRPATRSDASSAAFLLAETMGGFGVSALGLGSKSLELAALSKWFSNQGNRFSYQETLLAVTDGEVAGLLLRFTGARLAALELGCARQIFSIYGFFGAFGMVWRNKVLGGTKEADKNEYLIAHLAVDPRFRRQGIAKSLIECAVSETQTHGFSRLVLEVEIGNEPAINLYKKMGFSVVHTREFKQYSALLSCPGFHKMLKIIKGVCDGE